MFKRKSFTIIISIVILFLTLPFVRSFLSAQEIPSYNVRDIIAGKVPDIQAHVLGSGSMGNLGLILRVSSTRTDSFDIIIPAGTLFGGLSPGVQLLNNENFSGAQGFLTVFGQRERFPQGRPEFDQAKNLNTFVNDVLIYALCYDVNLPLPDTSTAFDPSVDSLESISRIAKMIQGFENFHIKMQQIDAKIKANQTLTDDETRYATFIEWIEEPGQFSQISFQKNGVQRRNNVRKFFPHSKYILNHNYLETYTPEIWRYVAQNVVWTMAPADQDFSPESVRNDISNALHIYDSDSLDNLTRQANSFLELLGLGRRLLVVDSLRYPISHFIDYPPLYIISWSGAGGGWASRMALPYENKYKGCKWQILDIGYYLQSESSGNFHAAILANSNGSPGSDLMNRKTISFPALPDGEFVTVDVSGENIIVNEDFFVALFQTAAYNPNVILSEAINGRAFGFNAVSWSAEAMALFFQATLKLVNAAPSTPGLVSPADNQTMQADQAKFVWTKAKDPDAGNIVTYQLQFSLQNDFSQLLHKEENLSDTTFFFVNLPQSVRDQMNGKIIYWRVQAKDNFGGVSQFSSAKSFILQSGIITNSDSEINNLPKSFALYQNYPNPFNPYTVIKFDVPLSAHISIKIFNQLGQNVKTLVDQRLEPGYHRVIWDGTDKNGLSLASGVYLIQMKTKDYVKIRKITFLH